MEIGARLHHIQLLSADPDRCAEFFARLYGMAIRSDGPNRICTGPQRRLIFAPGRPNQLGYAAFAFESASEQASYRRGIEARIGVQAAFSPLFGPEAFSVVDPDGNRIVFGVDSGRAAGPGSKTDLPLARLQHFATRSSDPATLRAFYRDALGFVVSDSVYNDAGELRACFLRTDSEHHAMAVFHAEQGCHDHLSLETADWTAVRDWADRITALGVPMVWGIGRHGPGNDTFFMVRDPDGNLVEISAELEVCNPTRSEGTWRHEQRTLNLWGSAIMRS
jgi:catechol 2,3-dioxygenase-like lactoylglutathione lyase family enzyme